MHNLFQHHKHICDGNVAKLLLHQKDLSKPLFSIDVIDNSLSWFRYFLIAQIIVSFLIKANQNENELFSMKYPFGVATVGVKG